LIISNEVLFFFFETILLLFFEKENKDEFIGIALSRNQLKSDLLQILKTPEVNKTFEHTFGELSVEADASSACSCILIFCCVDD